nr:hypothetical protein [Micromonospora sp. DSM 115978]
MVEAGKGTARDPDDMTEAELAAYFFAHRDDLAGEEVESRRPDRMDVMISTRFSRSEAVEVRAAAERARMSVSAFIRQRVLVALSANVVDLDRVRADLRDMQSKAADALSALEAPEPGDGARPDSAPRKAASA